MKNIIELKILGQRLVVQNTEGEDYVKRVEEYLNEKIDEVKENTSAVSTLDLAILTALNMAGEVIKAKEELEKLEQRSQELTQRIDRRSI